MSSDVPASHRREQIVELLRQRRAVTVRTLAERFGVTTVTARRDLTELESVGLAIRVHGGAVAPVARQAPARRGRRPTVGMIVPDISFHWPAVTAAAQLEAAERHVRLIVRRSQSYGRDTREQIAQLTTHTTVDGLIVAPFPTGPERTDLEQWIASHSSPVVYIDRSPDDPGLATVQSVGTDNRAGGAIAARHLAALGHRRMLMVTNPVGPGAPDRIDGWRFSVRALGLADPPVLPSVPLNDREQDVHLASTIDQIKQHGATAVFVNGDLHALALLQACHDRGIRVPDDLSLVGYDDDLATLGSPPLTSIRTATAAIGRMAVRLAAQALARDPNYVAQRIHVVPTLVVRETSGPPPSS